jgi:hypothetical protein
LRFLGGLAVQRAVLLKENAERRGAPVPRIAEYASRLVPTGVIPSAAR